MLKERRTEPPVFLSSLRVCSPATNSWAPMSGSLKITVLINMLRNYCEADRAGSRERERDRAARTGIRSDLTEVYIDELWSSKEKLDTDPAMAPESLQLGLTQTH